MCFQEYTRSSPVNNMLIKTGDILFCFGLSMAMFRVTPYTALKGHSWWCTGPYVVLVIESGSVACKASTLPICCGLDTKRGNIFINSETSLLKSCPVNSSHCRRYRSNFYYNITIISIQFLTFSFMFSYKLNI